MVLQLASGDANNPNQTSGAAAAGLQGPLVNGFGAAGERVTVSLSGGHVFSTPVVYDVRWMVRMNGAGASPAMGLVAVSEESNKLPTSWCTLP